MIQFRLFKSVLLFFAIVFFSMRVSAIEPLAIATTAAAAYEAPAVVDSALLGIAGKEGLEFTTFLNVKMKEMERDGFSFTQKAWVGGVGALAFFGPVVASFFMAPVFNHLQENPNFPAFVDFMEGATKLYGAYMMWKLEKTHTYDSKKEGHARKLQEKKIKTLEEEANRSGDEFAKKLVEHMRNKAKKKEKEKEKSFRKHLLELVSQSGREGAEIMVFTALASIIKLQADYPYSAELMQSLIGSVSIGLGIPLSIVAVGAGIKYGPVMCKEFEKMFCSASSTENHVHGDHESEFCDCGLVDRMLYQYNVAQIFFTLFKGALSSSGIHEVAESLKLDVKFYDLTGGNYFIWDEKEPLGNIISALVPWDTDPDMIQFTVMAISWVSAFRLLFEGIYRNWFDPNYYDKPCCICDKKRRPRTAAVAPGDATIVELGDVELGDVAAKDDDGVIDGGKVKDNMGSATMTDLEENGGEVEGNMGRLTMADLEESDSEVTGTILVNRYGEVTTSRL
ncbi:MAG: hypothetical protein PUP46_08655 [Endozoicomonas sp. (ex Botrylloides leachii)]|nr:hypothetical protein [Endozoicomonas sp. (ex Botrylloides leachii)]